MSAERFRLVDFSVMIRPPRDRLMAVLRAYSDNSGDDRDPEQKCVSVAGYLGTIETWEQFDSNWAKVMGRFGVKYLHMKEFRNPDGIYSSFSADDKKEFLCALIEVIDSLDLAAFGSAVRLADLRRFNDETGLGLDAYSIALHECCQWIGWHCRNEIIEVVADRFKGVTAKIALAERYSRSSTHSREYVAADYMSVTALPKKLSFREIRPLQAADFFAWEMHREITHEDEWWSLIKPFVPEGHQYLSRIMWHASRVSEHKVNFPYHHRKSHANLRRASHPIVANIWDYQALREANEVRGGVW